MIYTEIGFGNSSFVSTEIETNNNEYRIDRSYIGSKFISLYVRIWIKSLVVIIDTRDGIKIKHKPTKNFKILCGLVSE